MNDTHLLSQLKELKIVPVVKLDSATNALPLAKALSDGGLPIAEITFRTDAAEDSIRSITRAFPDMVVGAGTIVNTEQAKRALDAGATFLVSPGVSRPVIEYALENHLAIFPGACTPTEVMAVMEYGLPIAKFFPAKQYGGLDTIKALSGPFPSMKFMPTGGIGIDNILEFLACDKIIACGGSWMVKDSLIKANHFEEITKLTKEAVTLVSPANEVK